MESYLILKDLAIIIIAAKFFGILARKCKAPQVVGEIVAGLLIGPCFLNIVVLSDFLSQMAEIGVILLMFSAGLETDLKEMRKTGFAAFMIAVAGVFVSLVGGFIFFQCYYGWEGVGTEQFFKAVFIGCIMTATSVSITVQSLKELGKIKGKVGTTIISAAIIDDVIGIIVLTFVIGFKNPESKPVSVIISTVFSYCRIFLWNSRYYRSLSCRDHSLFHKRFRIYSRKDGYQFIHALWTGILRQHRS